ncbi:hypothetical protein B0T26DRAFT_753155 [Lasiosphaeria miniovina]|uniref:Uncharacterized protein n=1 Tax=Lasiosphaeria miniovina TaxID=1954250 RepID=A0AA40DTQ2_9PEZI|nr:uncharacterized protein B0T26DRAFT_753155 [Lasiosphaeria miniovina]KAK0712987.1 hypothetical protein B0T26DRAFT_753155 [Lasiosphaeria miniovina]
MQDQKKQLRNARKLRVTWIKEYDITQFKKHVLNHEEKAIARNIEAHERKIAACLKKTNEQLAKEQSMALAEKRKLEEKQAADLKRVEDMKAEEKEKEEIHV